MTRSASVPAAPRRSWATSSLVAGLLWLILAVSPTFVTTLVGLPFAAYAFVVGAFSLWHSLRTQDRTAARRAGWGVGLGCAGFIWLGIWNVILGSMLVAALFAYLGTVPTATPGP